MFWAVVPFAQVGPMRERRLKTTRQCLKQTLVKTMWECSLALSGPPAVEPIRFL